MNQSIDLRRDHSLAIDSLTRRLVRHLGLWMAAVARSFLTETAPAASTFRVSALGKGRTVWVDQPMAREVCCLKGALWLTFDGVQKDFILEAGESHCCKCSSRLAIHAMVPAAVRVG